MLSAVWSIPIGLSVIVDFVNIIFAFSLEVRKSKVRVADVWKRKKWSSLKK